MSTTRQSKTVVKRYVDAIAAGDERTIRDSFAADATWILRGELPISGTWKGRDVIVDEFLAAALNYYDPDSIDIEVTGLHGEDDLVTVEWTSRARTVAGEAYENHCIGVFTVRDGAIQEVREYMDTLYAHKVAFGASEKTAA